MKNLNCRQLAGYSKLEKRLVMQHFEVTGKAPDKMELGADSTLADRDKRSDLYKNAEDKAKELEAKNVGDKDAKDLLDQVAAARAFENKEPEAAIAAQQLEKSLYAIMQKEGTVQPAKTEEKAVERPVQTAVEAKPGPKVASKIESTKPDETGASATDVFQIKGLQVGGEAAKAPKPKAEESSFTTIEGAPKPGGDRVIQAAEKAVGLKEKQPDEQ